MKKITLALVILLSMHTFAFAHHGAKSSSSKTSSIFDKKYKYLINTEDGHIGHFYVKRARASRKGNERLRIEHTIHLESDIVKKFNVRFDNKSSLLSYNYDMDGLTYIFNFYINEDIASSSNPGAMTIFNKSDNSFSVANVTLDLQDDSTTEDDGHDHGDDSHGDDGHSHS